MSGPPTLCVSASWLAQLLTMALILAAAPAAGAEGEIGPEASRQSAMLKLTTKAPDRPSALVARIDYVNPDDPTAKPPAVRRVVETLPRGAHFDTGAPELCTASDVDLILLGPAACPAGSVVGDGAISLDTGLPEPLRMLETDVTFLNNVDELLFVTALQPLGARVVIRAEVQRNRFISEAPFLPGGLPDGTAIDTVRAEFDRIVTERGSYVTTPPRCPHRRAWRSRLSFTYADGVTQRVDSRTRCKRAASKGQGRDPRGRRRP